MDEQIFTMMEDIREKQKTQLDDFFKQIEGSIGGLKSEIELVKTKVN